MAGRRGIPVSPKASPAIREGGRAEPRISPRCSKRRSTRPSPSPRTAGAARSANAGRSSPQLVNRSATADFPAIKLLFDIMRENERHTEPASPETAEFSEADQKVLEQIRSRFSKGEP